MAEDEELSEEEEAVEVDEGKLGGEGGEEAKEMGEAFKVMEENRDWKTVEEGGEEMDDSLIEW